ncbi:aminotransferase class V-fold PLP-dependent enzyme [Hydrogenobaculum acidophilum]
MILDPTSSYYWYLYKDIDLQDVFYNPMGINSLSLKAKETLIKARRAVSSFVGCKDPEIVFVGSSTEANNTIIKGANTYSKNKTILTTQLEHISILHPINTLAKEGFKVFYLPVDNYGDFVYDCIPENIDFLSVGAVCRETAQKRDIEKFCKLLREKNEDIFIHIDAWGLLYIDFDISLVDAISIDAVFLGAIPGISAFYIKKGKKIKPLIEGGTQERGLRAGEQNIIGIKIFKHILEYLNKNRANIEEFLRLSSTYIKENLRLRPLFKDSALGMLSYEIPKGSLEKLVVMMEKEGFYLNSSSPCMGTNTQREELLRNMLSITGDNILFRIPPLLSFDYVSFVEAINSVSEQL